MILTCPSCGTRYVVKDGAIPDGGRTVRCAQCKHSWHQEPGDAQASAEEPHQHIPEHHGSEQDQYSEVQEAAGDHPLGEESGDPRAGELGDHAHPDLASDDGDGQVLPGPDVRPQPNMLADEGSEGPAFAEPEPAEAETMPREAAEAADPYPEEVVPAEDESPRSSHPLRAARNDAEDPYSPFAARDDEEEPKRRWPLFLLIGLLVIAAIAAAIWFLAPVELKSRLGLAQADGQSQLMLQVNERSRRALASGNQLVEVSGLVINPTDETLSVPPLNAQLRSLDQKVVHSWIIPPPAPRLAPGASASFNSAELNIPEAAACIDVWIAPRELPPCKASDSAAPPRA